MPLWNAEMDDARDKLVTISVKGQRWRAIAASRIRSIEAEIAASIGENAEKVLRRLLRELMRAADP